MADARELYISPTTVSDLKELSEERLRYEQIGNVIYMMSTPSVFHEAMLSELMGQLWTYLDGKPCKVFGSNLGLDLKDFIPILKKLPLFQEYFKKKRGNGNGTQLYLLPDIQIIYNIDKDKFSSKGYRKSPKMIIEIFSPSTGGKDISLKKEIYEAIGVEEYWVVIDIHNVVVFRLKEGKYILPENYSAEENDEGEKADVLDVPVSVFPDLVIHFDNKKFNFF